MREHVKSVTVLPSNVGMGPATTLAKSCQWTCKEYEQFGGVLAISHAKTERASKMWSLQPVEEVWDVGRRISKNWLSWTSKLAGSCRI